LLWALVRHRLAGGAGLAESIVDTVRAVVASAPASRLNLLLTDGRTAVATTWWHALSVRQTPGATLISSEPIDDDPAWQPVPDRHLVVATAGTVETTPLT
jgi:gamma-glutamyl hercynylcysteine S-oxide hydrolase